VKWYIKSRYQLEQGERKEQMMHRPVAYLTIAALAIAATASATLATSITLIGQFDYPSTGASTVPRGINSGGLIVGSVDFPDGSAAGFVRLKNGTYKELTDPSGNGLDTQAAGINDTGEIVGFYENGGTSAIIGFTLVNGVYSDFLGAPATCNGQPCTADLMDINDKGDLVGGWFGPNSAPEQAFAVLGGVFTPITNALLSNLAAAFSISNNSAWVVGSYFDKTPLEHGFLYTVAGGAIRPINFPGAVQTVIVGINNRGTITGRYVDAGAVWHGIALIAGKWATYDFPGANKFTALGYINDGNIATGRYTDTAGITHGLALHVTP
jgi:hypothetical protein